MTLSSWANSWVGKEVKVPQMLLPETVIRVEFGKRKNGVWLVLSSGKSIYKRIPKGVKDA